MIDFTKITGQASPVDEHLEAFECLPKGFFNGDGKPLQLTMHPAHCSRFNKAARLVRLKEIRTVPAALPELAEGEVRTPVDPASEEELLIEVARQDRFTAEILARCCDGWNLWDSDANELVPCTLENRVSLFTALESLRIAVDLEVTAMGKKIAATKIA
jgi:hypothetical protein